jgi:putative PIN family toxin of toxin-antitoxin system
MRVCLDTNVLVQMFGRNQVGRPIREALLAGSIEWAISNEILFEYQETISRLSDSARWEQVEPFLTLLFHLHSNVVVFIEPRFRFQVILADLDDKKFVDCAVAAQADYVITSDHHFAALAESGYRPQPITPEEFTRSHL